MCIYIKYYITQTKMFIKRLQTLTQIYLMLKKKIFFLLFLRKLLYEIKIKENTQRSEKKF